MLFIGNGANKAVVSRLLVAALHCVMKELLGLVTACDQTRRASAGQAMIYQCTRVVAQYIVAGPIACLLPQITSTTQQTAYLSVLDQSQIIASFLCFLNVALNVIILFRRRTRVLPSIFLVTIRLATLLMHN